MDGLLYECQVERIAQEAVSLGWGGALNAQCCLKSEQELFGYITNPSFNSLLLLNLLFGVSAFVLIDWHL